MLLTWAHKLQLEWKVRKENGKSDSYSNRHHTVFQFCLTFFEFLSYKNNKVVNAFCLRFTNIYYQLKTKLSVISKKYVQILVIS